MKSRKYPSLQEAITYLESKGTLTYWGWEGQRDGYYIYTFVTHEGVKYHVDVFKSGLVRVKEW